MECRMRTIVYRQQAFVYRKSDSHRAFGFLVITMDNFSIKIGHKATFKMSNTPALQLHETGDKLCPDDCLAHKSACKNVFRFPTWHICQAGALDIHSSGEFPKKKNGTIGNSVYNYIDQYVFYFSLTSIDEHTTF